MSFDRSSLRADPERVFSRAMALVVAAWLASVLAGPLALGRLDQRAERATALAAAATAHGEAIGSVERTLSRLRAMASGPARDRETAALAREAGRLLAGPPPAAAGGDAEIRDAATAALERIRAGLAADGVGALHEYVVTWLKPQAARLAQRRGAEAARVQAAARLGRHGLLAAQLAAAAVLVAGVVLPARRRIADWVLANREIDRENRLRLLHDPLTHLPNAAYLSAHLAQLAAGADRATTQTAVLRLGLDRFRSLRDTLGQRTADEILRITARRIRQSMRAGDFAAYLGQDDFVLVASELEDGGAAAAIGHRVQQALAKPFSLQGGARRIGCSVGLTLLSDDLPEPDRALANAEIALAEAQDAGAGSLRYFREGLRTEVERRETLFTELLTGLERGEFMPFFQPQVHLATGAFSGFEALVRWRHPAQGLLAPGAFLEFAEAADLTERIGEAVLGQTLAALTAWDAAGLRVPKVGINFAMAQLRDPRLIEKIKWEVERHDIEPARISIEVLETVLIKSDADMVVRNLRGLKSAGFTIELDDFGTGHASIQNLRRFMVDRIKIDRSFVHGIETSGEQQTLTSSMIAMARALEIETLAEGVESAEAAQTLRRLGCDHFQGYFIARPMSQADTFGWLAAFSGGEGASQGPARPSAKDPN